MLPLTVYIIAGVFGAIFGSFLNVVVLRDKRRSSILTGRSACPNCKHELSWYELLPVFSFLLQGGSCRSCRKPISWQYPLVELASASLAIFTLWYGMVANESWLLVFGIYLALAALLVISLNDFRTMEVRPEYAIFAGLVGGLAQGLSGQVSWSMIGLGILIGGGSIFILAYGWKLITGRLGMGEGDIWIAGAIGALVGYPLIVPALFLAVAVGAVVGLLWAARVGKGLAIEMPFGPFLALGALLALIWGQAIVHWYIL